MQATMQGTQDMETIYLGLLGVAVEYIKRKCIAMKRALWDLEHVWLAEAPWLIWRSASITRSAFAPRDMDCLQG